MGRTIRRSVLALLCLFPLFLTSAVHAQDARALFGLGQEAYQHGNYEVAIDMWERAYALDPRPALQYNLAQGYGRLARIDDEADSLRLYLAGALASGTDPNDPQISTARARLVAIAERMRRTGIQFSGVPAGAVVHVDGVQNDSGNGVPISLGAGAHQVRVSSEGFSDFNASVSVRAGENLLVAVTMQRQAAQVASASGSSGISGRRLGGVLCLSVGGVALLVGGSLGGLALNKSSGAVDGSSQADSARGLALGSDIMNVVAAGLGAAGLVLVLTGHHDSETPAVAFAPVVTSRVAGVQVFGRF